ncbi:TAFII55 protein conserved region-domain-containing protein, partial [Gorgonomyces haynaldii]
MKDKPKIKVKNIAKGPMEEALAEAPIEEHLIIRFPPKLAQKLQDPIKNRQVPEDLQFTFNDQRKGTLKFKEMTWNTVLVDLPCITESLKTIDNKQFYKVADISQMVIVQDHKEPYRIQKDFVWPDGLSAPLKNVRTNRFRKRMSKKTIEDVEAEVERLLLQDLEAQQIRFEVHERKENEEDEEMDDFLHQSEAGTQQEDDFLDQEINEALDQEQVEEEQADESESEEENEQEESENEGELDEQSDNEEDEQKQMKKMVNVLKHEITDLEKKVQEKQVAAQQQVNPIMKKRLEEIVTKLSTELKIKREQLENLEEEIESQQMGGIMYMDEEGREAHKMTS